MKKGNAKKYLGTSKKTMNNQNKKAKKFGKSCKYCYYYEKQARFCMSFKIDISSLTNANRCKNYCPLKRYRNPNQDYLPLP